MLLYPAPRPSPSTSPFIMQSSCRKALLVAVLLAAIACLAAAGGYGRGKPHRIGLYKTEEYYYNHSPAPAANSVPDEFNWCAHEGVNYCTPSWNQHIPQ